MCTAPLSGQFPHLRLLLRTFTGMYSYFCPHLRLLLRTFSRMYSYFWMWRMSFNATKWTFLAFYFVCLLYDLLSFFFTVALHLESTLLGVKDILFMLLGFPRHASLRDRSPASSEPYVTLDSRSSLNRTTFGVRTPFFPGSHLRVSRTPWTFRVTRRILSHRYAVPRDETTCACFHLQKKIR